MSPLSTEINEKLTANRSDRVHCALFYILTMDRHTMKHNAGIQHVTVNLGHDALNRLFEARHDGNVKNMLPGMATSYPRFEPEDIIKAELRYAPEELQPEIQAIVSVWVKRGEWLAGRFVAEHAICGTLDVEYQSDPECIMLTCYDHATNLALDRKAFREEIRTS